MHLLWMMLSKQGETYIYMLRLRCCLPPPIKISDYVPDYDYE